MLRRIAGTAALLVLALAWAGTDAVAQKIGYTNQEAILANMPEMDSVRARMQQIAQQQRQEFQQEQQELQQQMQKYQQQQALLSDQRRQQREQELRQMQMELQRSAQERDSLLAQRRSEMMEPLLEELQAAIDQVSQERGLDVVMRTQALLYVNRESSNVVDITEDVATRLGIDLSAPPEQPQPSVSNPGASGRGGTGGSP
jgi:outer membrane protein